MKIAVLGASVSAQALNHQTGEVTGYVEVIRRHHLRPGDEISQVTYAGNRASDGGVVRALEVAAMKPDICLFEPLIEDRNRGSDVSEAELAFIYSTLLDAGILPITLLLPEPRVRFPDRMPGYHLIAQMCHSASLPMIPVSLEGNLEGMFHGVHTQLPGATFYATQVIEGITNIGTIDEALRKIDRKALTHHLAMTKIDLSLPEILTDVIIGIRQNELAETATRIRVIQHQTIGPFSPVLAIRSTDDTAPRLKSIWDPYCHFPRASYVVLHEGTMNAAKYDIRITCSVVDPEYATCRRPVESWPAPESRHMKPLGPIYILHDRPMTARIVLNGD